MVKDLKYIIKRILIGTGIAILLMLFKGNLAYDVHAMSCGSDYTTTFDSKYSSSTTYYNVSSDSLDTSNTSAIWKFSGTSSSNFTIPSGYAYALIKIPVTYGLNAQSNSTTTAIDVSMSPPNFILFENSYNVNNDVWRYGWYDGGYAIFRIDVRDVGRTVKIRGMAVNIPRFYYNFGKSSLWISFQRYWTIEFYKCDDNSDVQNAIDENTQAQKDTNNTLKDDSVDDNKTSSSIDNMKGKVATNGSISQLLTLPITLYQNILNSLSGGCSSFNLGSLFGSNLTMPCINLQNLLGSTLYGIIDVLISGLFILSFRKKMVDIFNHMTSLNDRGNELE